MHLAGNRSTVTSYYRFGRPEPSFALYRIRTWPAILSTMSNLISGLLDKLISAVLNKESNRSIV